MPFKKGIHYLKLAGWVKATISDIDVYMGMFIALFSPWDPVEDASVSGLLWKTNNLCQDRIALLAAEDGSE